MTSPWETVKSYRFQLQYSKDNVKLLTEILSICRTNYIFDKTEPTALKGQDYTGHI